MLTRFSDFDKTFAMMDQLRRRMDHLFGDYESGRFADFPTVSALPRFNVYDTPGALIVQAEVPGLSEKDIELNLNDDVLTVSGARKSDAPEGYSVHRRERAPYKFSRSLSLPYKVDGEKCSATVKHGLLTINLPKIPEAQPRKIAVNAG